MIRYRARRSDDEGASLIMTMVFVTGVGLVVAALLSYGAGALSSAAVTARSAQAEANVAGALQTAINDVRNSVYVNDGVTPCLGAGNRRTYPSLTSAGLPTTVTCGPDPSSGSGSGASVPINPQNRPLGALLTLGTYSSGAAPGVAPADPTGVTVTPPGGPAGTAVVVTGSGFDRATAVQVGTTAEIATAAATTLTPCVNGINAAGCFTANGNTLTVSVMPAHVFGVVDVKVITLGTGASGTFTYQTRPNAPVKPGASAGQVSATVTWVAPADGESAITGYLITPIKAGVAQTPVTVGATPLTATLDDLTAGASYTFTVAAINALGTSPASPASAAVVPFVVVPGAPVIGTPTTGDLAAIVRWTAPVNDGGSDITGYVVTPYLGGTTAQTPRSFASTATTQTVTGLNAGSSYTFKVSATTSAGTGPASAASASVAVNALPTLTYATALPAGKYRVAYSYQLTKAGGTTPYTWSISAGALPSGLSLNGTTGLISGTPVVYGNFTFTVRLVDSFGAVVTKATTLVITQFGPNRVAGATPDDIRFIDGVADPAPLRSGPYAGTVQAAPSIAEPIQSQARAATGVATGAVTGRSSLELEELHAFLRTTEVRRLGRERRDRRSGARS